MSNRFHNKFHRHNHHTQPTDRDGMYPDSAYDPIASPEAPFQGDFHVQGDIFSYNTITAQYAISSNNVLTNNLLSENITSNQNLSAKNNLFGKNLVLQGGLTATTPSIINNSLTVNSLINETNEIIKGDLFVEGDVTVKDKVFLQNLTETNENSIHALTIEPLTKELKNKKINPIVWSSQAEILSTDSLLKNKVPLYSGKNTLINSPIEIVGNNTSFNGDIIVKGLVYDRDGFTNSSDWALATTLLRSISTEWLNAISDISLLDQILTTTYNPEIGETQYTFKNALSANAIIESNLVENYLVKASQNDAKRLRQSLLLYDDDNSIGIGTNSPQGKLHISSGTGSRGNCSLYLESNTNADTELSSSPQIIFRQKQTNTAFLGHSGNDCFCISTSSSQPDAGIKIYTGGISNNTERISISSTGQVGIGTPSIITNHQLTVNGGLSTDYIITPSITTQAITAVKLSAQEYVGFRPATLSAGNAYFDTISAGSYINFNPQTLSAQTAKFDSISASEYLGFNPRIIVESALPSLSVVSGIYASDATFTNISASNYLGMTVTGITALQGDVIATGKGQVNATLTNTGVVSGNYGNITGVLGVNSVPKFTVNSQGRITTAENIALYSIRNFTGDIQLQNSNPNIGDGHPFGIVNATIKPLNPSPAGKYGEINSLGTTIPSLSVDDKGRVVSVETIQIKAISAISGDIVLDGNNGAVRATLANTTVKAGVYGTSTLVPTISVDSKGRITGIATNNINLQGTDGVFNKLQVNTLAAKAVTQSYVEPVITSGVCNIDLALGNVFNINVTEHITGFKLNNTPSGVVNLVLKINQTNFGYKNVSIQFADKVIRWIGGLSPTPSQTPKSIDIYSFFTINGIEWFGGILGQGYK